MIDSDSGAIQSTRHHQLIGLFLGIIGFMGIHFLDPPSGLSQQAWVVLSLVILMVSWWVTEAIPIPVTSLLPIVVLPVFGVVGIREAAAPYASPIVMLLLGGFIIAKSVERWNLHARIAFNIVLRAGAHPAGIVAGFMVASALLSMWISNTATTIMLTPIALSVARAIVGARGMNAPLTISLLLGIAYGASIGGLGTPVGTPTNLIVMGYLEDQMQVSISFTEWMMLGVPVVLVMLPMAWFTLTRWALRLRVETGVAGQEVVLQELAALGPIKTPEVRVLIVFSLIAAAWVMRRPLNQFELFGATPFIHITDHVIAIAGAILLFMIPSGCQKERGTSLLDWETAVQIPWGVILLFGGGLSLAAAITSSGLAAWLGGQIVSLTMMPPIIIIFALVTFVIFATELSSNVATVSALLPVIGAIAQTGDIDVLLLALPIAMAASCAFMLPMATGPNAIVFASNHVSIAQMARVGFRLNLIGILLITMAVSILMPVVF